MGIHKKRLFLPGILVSTIGLYTLFIALEKWKSEPEFCVSCHLSPTQKLHQNKYDNFRDPLPKNMSALHRKEISCIGCHESRDFLRKSVQIFKESWNTLRYFFGTFREPEELSLNFVDDNCRECHAQLKSMEMFHRAQAHGGKFLVRCTECHPSHKTGGKKERYFIPLKNVRDQCILCHPNYPKVEEYLKQF